MARDRGAYANRLDAETWAFIDATDACYPPDTAEMTVDEQRAVYDRMCRAFHAGYPEGVSAHDGVIETDTHAIPVRVYTPAGVAPDRPRIVYFHGGGFVVGGLESHDDVCAEISAGTACEVVSVGYRLSPEHRHPAAFEDALAGYDDAAARDGRAALVCGDSAGGNLAAAVAHRRRREGKAPIGQVLIYPGLGGDWTAGSYAAHAEAPMLTMRDLQFYKSVRTGGPTPEGDPTLAPLADTDFSGLPPTVVVSAECDPLSSDGEVYCARIRAAGGKAVWFNETGLVHGYLRARHSVARAGESFTRILSALNALAEGAWPYS